MVDTLKLMSRMTADFKNLAEAYEVLIETRDDSRSFRTVIWVVEGGGDLYVRSYRGDTAQWFVRAQAHPKVSLVSGGTRVEFTAVPATDERSVVLASDGFRAKYAGDPYLEAMLSAEILHTTMRLDAVA